MTEANIINCEGDVSKSDEENLQNQCAKKAMKLIRGKYASWTHDQNDAGKTSLDTIVEWLIQGDNYFKYKGSLKAPGESNKKTAYCKNIAEILVETGHAQRDFKGIMSQISELEAKFRIAVKELEKISAEHNIPNIDIINGEHNETFIDERGNKKALKDVVRKKFKYFYVLRSIFQRWEDGNPEGSSKEASHEVEDPPSISSNKRQRDQDEQYFDAPDTHLRDEADIRFQVDNNSTLVLSTSAITNGNNNAAQNNATQNNTSNHNGIIAATSHNHTPVFPVNNINHRAHFQYYSPVQPAQPAQPAQQVQQSQPLLQQQTYNPVTSNDSEQAQKKQKKLQKQQDKARFNQSLQLLLDEQKESLMISRASSDRQLALDKERFELEKQRLALEERQVALEERKIALEEQKEFRIAFFAGLDHYDRSDPKHKEYLDLFMKRQIPSESDSSSK